MATPSMPPSPCATTSAGLASWRTTPVAAMRNLIGPGRSVNSMPPPGVKARSHGFCRPLSTVDTVNAGAATAAVRTGSAERAAAPVVRPTDDTAKPNARNARHGTTTDHGGPPQFRPPYAQSQSRPPPVWYSMTRVSKKFFSFFRSIISLIHGNGFSVAGYSGARPIWAHRRLVMKCM